MTAFFRFITSPFVTIGNRLSRCNHAMRMVLCVLPVVCGTAAAQTTAISGTVFDPRTTSNALPLSNVLVYATTAPVAALPAGVQCLTYQAPTGVVSYTYTAVDGTFTLSNIPENATYIVVIQAGKWRRQFPNEAVGTTPLTGLVLHMPANHTQGDIPMIAIVTGKVDGAGMRAAAYGHRSGGVYRRHRHAEFQRSHPPIPGRREPPERRSAHLRLWSRR